MNIDSKSNLAKLLATEDISVEHANVETAYFDLKERKIVLPNWKDMPEFMYDLLIGHEVGHALVTPLEGWHDATCNEGPAFKGFLNVVEDARNERLVKQRYPGLVKSFYKAYGLLYKKDFFGVKDRDPATLSLIDRINLHYKVGSMLNLSFVDAEQRFIDAIDVAETWEDVEQIARELFDFAKEEMQQQQQMPDMSDEESDEDSAGESMPSEQSDSQEDSDESQESESAPEQSEQGEESDEESNSDATNSQTDSETAEESDSDEQSEESQESEVADGNEVSDDPISITDQNFRANEGRLLEESNENIGGVATVKVPKLNQKRTIIPVSKTWEKPFSIKEYGNWNEEAAPSIRKKFINQLVTDFQNKNKSAINQLVMQFEMKRKASELRKAQVNNTGKLNEDKLWAYKLTDDLFLSNTVVPKGQNHGMFMILDMSGSMSGQMAGTVEQLLIQVAFCKKVGIPFDVYGFSCQVHTPDSYGQKHKELSDGMIHVEGGVGLVQLITSELSSADYTNAFESLLQYAHHWKSYGAGYGRRYDATRFGNAYVDGYDMPNFLQLGSTPLAQSMLCAIDPAVDFKIRNKIEVLNTIVLTDGGNTDEFQVVETDIYGEHRGFKHYGRSPTKLVLKYGITSVTTKHEVRYSNWGRVGREISMRSANAIFKTVTGSRLVHLFLTTKGRAAARDAWSFVSGQNAHWNEGEFTSVHKKFWLKKDYMPVDSVWGYDAAFVIKGGADLQIDDVELEIKSEKKADVLRGFRQFQSKKTNSRHFINRFIDLVA
jgi:hypothetical protein